MIASKRNRVIKEGNRVIKTFIVGDINQELFVYKKLKNANVDCADIITVDETTLVLSYIPGKTLLEYLIECEKSQQSMQTYFQYWTDYMKKFHQAMNGFRFSDVNYANFIVVEHKIIAVDFENVETGTMIQDVAAFICYGLFYKPIATKYKKNQLSIWFKQNYSQTQSKEKWFASLEYALFELNKRRNTEYEMDWNFLFD